MRRIMKPTDFRAHLAAVEAAVARADWADALSLARQAPGHRPKWRPEDQQELSAAVHDWAGVLAAEARLLRRQELDTGAELPPKQIAAGVSSRIKLGLLDEARDILTLARKRHPGNQRLLRQEALLYFKAQRYSEALTRYIELHAGGDESHANRIAACLIEQNELDRCAAWLAEAGSGGNPRHAAGLLRARCALAEALGQPAEAVAVLQQDRQVLPEPERMALLAQYAATARDTSVLEGLLAEVSGWVRSGFNSAALVDAGVEIVLAHWKCCLDSRPITPVLEFFERRTLAPVVARNLAEVVSTMADFQRAANLLQRSLEDFPSEVRNWQKLLSVLGAIGGNEACKAARQLMFRSIPEDAAFSVLARVSPDAWEPSDVPRLIRLAERTIDSRVSTNFIEMLRRLSGTRIDVEAAVQKLIAESEPLEALRLEFVIGAHRDRSLLRKSVVENVAFARFEENRSSTVLRVTEALDRCNREATGRVAASIPLDWLQRCAAHVDLIRARAPHHVLETEESFGAAVVLARLLVDLISSGRPSSVLRLGDGEGHFLPSRVAALSNSADMEETQRLWWGKQIPDAGLSHELASDFCRSVASADIIGILPKSRLARSAAKGGGDVVHRGTERSLDYMARATAGTVITSALFPHDLRYWNLWEEILAAVEAVSWISCHELADTLHDQFAVATRRKIVIPPEEKWAGLFRSVEENQRAGSSTLFDRHAGICQEIDPKPGEVWLIAAGFLGKIYADIVKSRGGIGIDIGSLADFWMGFRTRNFQLDISHVPALRSLCISDHGVPDRRDRILGRADVVRSSRSARFNAATQGSKARVDAVPVQNRLLRVLGHPRCATGYMATAFNAYGLQIGHEKVLRDGTSSWLAVAADLAPPFGDPCTYGFSFETTVLCLRDPASAIPSIILENGIAQSFNFRRMHILRETGVDISDYDHPVARAVASYIHWYEMAGRLKPDLVVRVEDGGTLERWIANRFPGFAKTSENLDMRKFNATDGKARFGQPKPVLTANDWSFLPRDLLQALASFCDTHGYAVPWQSPGPSPQAVPE